MAKESSHCRDSTLQNLKPDGTHTGCLIVYKILKYKGPDFRVFAVFTIFTRRLLAEFMVFTIGPTITTFSIFIVSTVSTIFTVYRINPIPHYKK
jgi:hypothetical protein